MNLTILTLLILSLATTVCGQQAKIEGHVYNDKDGRVAFVRIVVTPGGQASTTDNKGHFIIRLPDNIQPGQAARIRVEKANWVIFNPMFGNCATQSTERNYEPMRVVIVPRGSLLALSPKRISEVIAQWAVERSKQAKEINRLHGEVNDLNRELSEYAFLRRYAEEYGFTLDKFAAAADQWARSKNADDTEESALKEYWRKNYASAARLAREAAQTADEELERANLEKTEVSRKVIRRYMIEGNSRYAEFKFREALEAYGIIEQRFETRKILKEDFAKEWAEVKVLIGSAKSYLGTTIEGAEGPRYLAEAVAAYRQAETFYTRERSPLDWVMMQNHIGVVHRYLGIRAEGAEAIKHLHESAAAYRAALEVFTYTESPQDWEVTQNNLGLVLNDLSRLTAGTESIRYLNEAATIYRALLEVRTRAKSSQGWAATQNNLGNVLLNLGERAEGADGIKYLNEAAAAYRTALEVFTRTEQPYVWAMMQSNLCNTLEALGTRVERPDSVRYLKEAEAACRATLEVRTRAQLPQQWALTQNNLGNVLSNLGTRTEGAESIKYLNEAAATYRAALEVRTRAELPQQWAMTQGNLGIVLSDLGERAEGADGIKYLSEAAAAHRAALEVFTREHLPRHWAIAQKNLAHTYFSLSDWARASEAYVNVLQVHPEDADAYRRAALLYHEMLFKFDQAFALHQQWLAQHPGDFAAQLNFAETHFTTARFSECRQRVSPLIAHPRLHDSFKTAIRAIEIACLLGDYQAKQVPDKLDALIAAVSGQPAEFNVIWGFEGTRYFIGHNEKLSRYRVWLEQLLDALASKDRDTILKALQRVRAKYKD